MPASTVTPPARVPVSQAGHQRPFWPALKTVVALVAADACMVRWNARDQLEQHGPEALQELLRHWPGNLR